MASGGTWTFSECANQLDNWIDQLGVLHIPHVVSHKCCTCWRTEGFKQARPQGTVRQRASVVTITGWLRSDCNGIRCRFCLRNRAVMLVAKAEFPAPGDPLNHVTLWPLTFLAAGSGIGYSVSSGIFKGLDVIWKLSDNGSDVAVKRRWLYLPIRQWLLEYNMS